MSKLTFILFLISSLFLSCNPVRPKNYTKANNYTIYDDVDVTKYYFKIKWKPLTNELIGNSIKQNKPIFLYFYDSKCHYCVSMILSTFHYPPVVRKLNEDYYPVLIDTTNPDNIGLVNTLLNNIQLPTFGVVFPSKTILHSGYTSGKSMYDILDKFKPDNKPIKLKLYGTQIVEN